MNRIYSNREEALKNAEKFISEVERTVYVYRTIYPSGEEFSYRYENDLVTKTSDNIIACFEIPFNYKFRIKENAKREKARLSEQLGKKIGIRKHRNKINGYDFINFYTLTNVHSINN